MAFEEQVRNRAGYCRECEKPLRDVRGEVEQEEAIECVFCDAKMHAACVSSISDGNFCFNCLPAGWDK